MEKNLINDRVETLDKVEETDCRERQPAREFHIDAAKVKNIRRSTGLSQIRFAETIDVAVGTLRNWEQGRRDPEGPARALLRAIDNDTSHVLAALKR